MWITCLVISVGLLALALLAALGVSKSGFAKSGKFSMLHWLIAGVVAAAFVMFLPIHVVTEEASFGGAVRAILLSAFNTTQIFGLGCEFSVIHDSMQYCPTELNIAYQVWSVVLLVLAPAFTFGFVLSLFKNMSANLQYFFAYFKEAYIFAALNEKSLVLARDIKDRHPKAAIVFTDVLEDGEDGPRELVGEAKKIGAICFKKNILSVDFSKHSAKKAIFFFVIADNETENLNQSLELIEAYQDRENTHIYVFSTKIESEILLTSVEKGQVKVRRVNEVKSLVNRVLYERGEIIFNSATQGADGLKHISAVVIGMGRHGTEMVKALSWFGQMNGYRLEINAFDKDPLAQEKFTALAPELMSPAYNGVTVEGEAQYKITIHSNADVETISFANEIAKIRDASYVMVALGNDDVNINTAVRLRMYFERMGIHPVIQAIVYNTHQKQALRGLKNYRGQEYDIDFIGDMESSYTETVIIDSDLEEDALQRHLKWGKEEEFWTYEYNYRSSMASAIHMRARIKCGIPGAEKKGEDLTPEERHIIEVLEHRRWNAYMRSEGYVFSGSTDKSSRNDLAKMHHDLVDFESLTEEVKRKDSSVGTF